MKGAVAVMVELALAGAPLDCLFFGREELPAVDSALAPLLARERLDYELVVMMEPTDNELHAGCLGNVNATWTFHGRSGHSARPWDADNAIHAAARAIAALADHEREEHVFDGLSFFEVASVTQITGGIAGNVIPDRVDAHVNYRYAPGRTPAEAEARLRELCAGGELTIDSLAPSGPVATGNPRARALIAAGDLRVAPKQAWTPVAEFGAAGIDAVNFGPGAPAQAHRRDESVEIAALVRSLPRAGGVRGVRLSPVLTGLRKYPFLQLNEARARLAAAGVPVIDFGIGEPREDTPAFIRDALVQAIEPQSRYPLADGLAELRAAIATWAGRRFGTPLDPDTDVIPTFGSKEAVFHLAQVLAGDLIVVPAAGLPGVRARRRVRRQGSGGPAAARRGRLPARPRCRPRRRLGTDRDPVAELPEQPDRRDRAA